MKTAKYWMMWDDTLSFFTKTSSSSRISIGKTVNKMHIRHLSTRWIHFRKPKLAIEWIVWQLLTNIGTTNKQFPLLHFSLFLSNRSKFIIKHSITIKPNSFGRILKGTFMINITSRAQLWKFVAYIGNHPVYSYPIQEYPQ